MKKIFFVSYGGGHINIINELVKGMIDNKNIEFKVLALTTAYNNSINLKEKIEILLTTNFQNYKLDFKNWSNIAKITIVSLKKEEK